MRHGVTPKLLSVTLLLALAPAVRAGEYLRSASPLAQSPAIQGLRISNDRWPDAFTLRSFAEDAIRIERARSQEEEAVALYHWIARVMTIGGSPFEGPKGQETNVLDTLKIMNVYGNHWCDGQARLFETMWRSLGRQAHRLYIPMRHHSFVELQWTDADGQGRWHALDVNNGWFVRNQQGWIASSEDIERNPLLVIAANQDLKMRTKGWLRTHLSQMPQHSMAMHLRRGEGYTLRWDNEGVYYVNPKTRASVSADSPLYKPGGAYSQFIGGGEMVFSPDLAGSAWTEDLCEAPENVTTSAGQLGPAAAGKASSFTYQFDFPFLIADAVIEATAARSDARASAAISFSVDRGKTWIAAWSSTDIGRSRLKLGLGADRDRAGLPSVLGLYSYLIRFELQAQGNPSQASFSDLRFIHRTMMNKMALPNLLPGWNRFKLAAQTMTAGSALKIILEWSDKDGPQQVERTTARLPYEFEVFANAGGGAAVKMRSLRLEAIQQPGRAQPDAKLSPLETLKHGTASRRIRAIIEAGLSRDAAALNPLVETLKDKDPEIRYWAADSLGKIGDSRAIPTLIDALRDPFEAVRMSACVALGDLKAKEALPALIDLVGGKTPPGKGYSLFIPEDVGAARWMAAHALGRIGDRRAVEPLAQILSHTDGDLGLFIAQALGELGDRSAVPALLEAARKRKEPELRGVVEALGQISDEQAVPVLLNLLRSGKEDVRCAAAVALGRIGGPQAVAILQEVSQSDAQAFVREAAAKALERAQKAGKNR